MVGISRESRQWLARRWAALTGRQRAAIGAVAACAIAAVAWTTTTAMAQDHLLRLDVDLAPADAAAMRFAVSQGRGVYQKNCASCHGADAHGNMAHGVPNLADNDWLYGEGQASDIETVIRYGIRASNSKTWRLADMPGFAQAVPYAREPGIKPLSPGDIRDLVQFLASIRGATFDAAAAGRGAQLFSDRGGCYDCHASDGHGDPAIGGPNLADNIWLYGGDDKAVFTSIAKGRAGFCPAWVTRLSPAQIRETALYVYSLSHPPVTDKRPQ